MARRILRSQGKKRPLGKPAASRDLVDKLADKDEFVTVADLAKELRRAPLTVRMYLRDAGVQKPSGHWKWPASSKELQAARRALGLP